MSNVIEAFGKAIMVFGIVLIIGAIFAYYYNTHGIYPFRDHVLILGVFGVASLFAGLVLLHSESEFLKV
ncbi:MAG: hypothetical protein QXJ07_00960 [Candidatus Bathyarchaeia archaeon]